MSRILLTLVALLGLTFSPRALSLPVSAAFVAGKPLAFIDLPTSERKSLGALFSLGADISLFVPDYPFAMGVYYDVFLKSNYGSMPVNNAGFNLSYYPFGKPIHVQDESGEVSSKSLGLSVFGSIGSGFTFMNIRDDEGAAVFGAAAYNLRVSSSMEYPTSEIFSVGATLMYQTTFGGKSALPPIVTVGYTGWSLLTRFVFTLN